MKMMIKPLALVCIGMFAAPTFAAASFSTSNTLVGWALLPAATFSDGPTSGQFAAPNTYGTNLPPFLNRQPVQGFSAVLRGADDDSFIVMPDNGFGGQSNSADALLRMYSVKPDFKTARGGSGTVSATNFILGTSLAQFSHNSRITLNDVNRKLTVPIQADYSNYYNDVSKPVVESSIKFGRLLTGADFDIESSRVDENCNRWFGDEFGPYLIKTDASGTVQRSEIPLPGVYAPENKEVVAGRVAANLPGSGGFEGMAINPRGDKLYTLLEKTVTGDAAKTLRINVFDIRSEKYTGETYFYPLDVNGTNIGDMTAVDDTRFIVIERNGVTATSVSGTPFKKLFLIDIKGVANGGTVKKTELVDLMNIADPDDLNGDGSTTFTFPYVTIEDVLILDPWTLLVINDNNFPYGGGRALASDDTEFLKIRLAKPLFGWRPEHRESNRCEVVDRRNDDRH
ncbi:MAG: esterase-like activity of phytase family protein [Spongiibacteraceae bacterium]